MGNKKYILAFYLIILVLLVSFVSASNVAYIYKSKTDQNILDIFSDLGYKVDLIKESSLPMDLSSYGLVFLGDENFAKEIQVYQYPVVIMNHYIVKKIGLTDSGISRLVSIRPLEVNFNGESLKVYTSAKDKNGVSIPYYYLNRQNIASSLDQYAGTYTTSSGVNFGDVISFGTEGDVLANGKVLQDNLCFFGISETDYWTTNSKDLFLSCIEHVYTAVSNPATTCTKDSDCGVNRLIGLPFCSNTNVFGNFISFKCNSPGTDLSYCSNSTSAQLIQNCSLGCNDGKCNEVTCNTNNDCNDNNSTTVDSCINPGTQNSICVYNIYNTLIRVVSFVATPYSTRIVLNFSATTEGNGIVKGYLLSSNHQNWTLVLSSETGYVFDGLTPSTDYLFYAKALNVNNIQSNEVNISMTTLASDGNEGLSAVSGGGGSGAGGGFSYCSTQWQCTDWSECTDSRQTRTCSVPSSMCAPEVDKPSESQACVESLKTESNSSSGGNENKTNNAGFFPITGAAIADMFGGKNTWLGVLIVIAIIGAVYFFVRKFTK